MFTRIYTSNIKNNKRLAKAHKDLEWFFYHSEAALGWKSNFSSMMRAWFYSKKHEDEDIEDQLISLLDSQESRQNVLEATNKERKILVAYQQLNTKQQAVIEAYYEEKKVETDTKSFFDSKVYVVLDKDKKEIELDGLMPGLRLLSWTKTASTIPEFSLAWLKKAAKKDTVKFDAIREEADELYFNALKAFAKNCK